jgi:hypothetical protein
MQSSLWKGTGVGQQWGLGDQAGQHRAAHYLLSPEGNAPQASQVEPLHVSSPSCLGNLYMEPLGTEDDFWGPKGPVATETADKERSLCR